MVNKDSLIRTSALSLLVWRQWSWQLLCFLFYFHTAIFLGSLKLPHTEVKKLILKCDQVVLTESAINSLLKYLPSPEQVSHKQTNKQTNKIRWRACKLFWFQSLAKIPVLRPNFHIFFNQSCEKFFLILMTISNILITWIRFFCLSQMQQLGNMKDNFDDLSDPEQFACMVSWCWCYTSRTEECVWTHLKHRKHSCLAMRSSTVVNVWYISSVEKLRRKRRNEIVKIHAN